jgi:hypothetical protein
MNEPSVDVVGHLVKLKCGHNGRFSHDELRNLTMHLDFAGFIDCREGRGFSPRKLRPSKYRQQALDLSPLLPRPMAKERSSPVQSVNDTSMTDNEDNPAHIDKEEVKDVSPVSDR